MKNVEIYTDGACRGNPGPGGWGVILIYGDHVAEHSGYKPNTTNQKMELYAAIQGLEKLKEPCNVKLYTDSAYLVNAFRQKWLDNWQRSGWLNSRKEPVKNRDLWEHLLRLCRMHKVKWVKVKGHSTNQKNNRCDKLAREAIKAGQS